MSDASATAEAAVDELVRLRVFAYAVEPLAPIYRAVMRAFTDGKARFRIHYRPDQVAAELDQRGFSLELPEGGLERAQLAGAPPVVLPSAKRVFVCENPAVVSVAADVLGRLSPPLVCLAGHPDTAALVLLRSFAEGGSELPPKEQET